MLARHAKTLRACAPCIVRLRCIPTANTSFNRTFHEVHLKWMGGMMWSAERNSKSQRSCGNGIAEFLVFTLPHKQPQPPVPTRLHLSTTAVIFLYHIVTELHLECDPSSISYQPRAKAYFLALPCIFLPPTYLLDLRVCTTVEHQPPELPLGVSGRHGRRETLASRTGVGVDVRGLRDRTKDHKEGMCKYLSKGPCLG